MSGVFWVFIIIIRMSYRLIESSYLIFWYSSDWCDFTFGCLVLLFYEFCTQFTTINPPVVSLIISFTLFTLDSFNSFRLKQPQQHQLTADRDSERVNALFRLYFILKEISFEKQFTFFALYATNVHSWRYRLRWEKITAYFIAQRVITITNRFWFVSYIAFIIHSSFCSVQFSSVQFSYVVLFIFFLFFFLFFQSLSFSIVIVIFYQLVREFAFCLSASSPYAYNLLFIFFSSCLFNNSNSIAMQMSQTFSIVMWLVFIEFSVNYFLRVNGKIVRRTS